MKPASGKINVFWFRRDLRLEDNCGLFNALASQNLVLPIFIFDSDILDRLEDKNDRRVEFIYNAVEEIRNELIKHGSSLLVMHLKPIDAFKQLIKQFNIEEVFTNHDYEPYAIRRDSAVKDFLNSNGIGFKTYKDQVIFEKDEIVKENHSPYTIYTPYSKRWKAKLTSTDYQSFKTKRLFGNFFKTKPFKIPFLKDIGFIKTGESIPSRELRKNIIMRYEKNRDYPAIEGTSRLSVHLRFGTISIRKLVNEALKLNKKWLDELIWREFYMMILFHYPRVVNYSFRSEFDNIKWRNNENEFLAWCEGKTGYPMVDAGMRELNETGYMHNRARMITASFLTKHLLIDWRWGETYFTSKLLDYELASNNGNWQWAAGTGCDAAPYFRIFNPDTQQKKFDPEFKYIQKWVVEFNSPEYPRPIVEHSFARSRAIEAYRKAIEKYKS
ncbi:MAG: cryptochrome/photolyase family protein [Ignavibacteria bacterium]